MTIKISTFNINSIKMRSTIVTNWLDESQTDILLMQETKSIDENFPYKEFEEKGFNVIFSGQKAYNGVAIASKFKIEEIDEIFLFITMKNWKMIRQGFYMLKF